MRDADRHELLELLVFDQADRMIAEGFTDDELREVAQRFLPEYDAARVLAEQKGLENLTMTELINVSSLGTPISRYMRSLCPPEVEEQLRELAARALALD